MELERLLHDVHNEGVFSEFLCEFERCLDANEPVKEYFEWLLCHYEHEDEALKRKALKLVSSGMKIYGMARVEMCLEVLFAVVQQDAEFLAECRDCLVMMFSNTVFVSYFASNAGFERLWQTVYACQGREIIKEEMNRILFCEANDALFERVSLDQVYKPITDAFCGCDEWSLRYLSMMFRKASQFRRGCTRWLLKGGAMGHYEHAYDVSISPRTVNSFVDFIESHNDDLSCPPNRAIISYFFQEIGKGKIWYFDAIESVVKDEHHATALVNVASPSVWIKLECVPVSNRIRLLKLFVDIIPDKTGSFLEEILVSVSACRLTDSDLRVLFHCVSTLWNTERSSTQISASLVTVFVKEISPVLFSELMLSDSHFGMIISAAIQEVEDDQLFIIWLDVGSQCLTESTYMDATAKLLTHNPNKQNLEALINIIDKHNSYSIVLAMAFLHSNEVAKSFVTNGCLEWLLLRSKLSLEQICCLLSELVHHQGFAEIDRIVESLPHDHHLFKANESELEYIVFGRSRAKYRPIRIVSLLPYISKLSYLDPYNSYLLGQRLGNVYGNEDILSIPYIASVSNRWISCDLALDIVKSGASCGGLVNVTDYDHFDCYQMFPSKHVTQISCSGQSLSFWVKYKDSIRTHLLLEVADISLVVEDCEIKVRTESSEWAKLHFAPKAWNLISICFESQFIGSTATVRVNQEAVQFGGKSRRFDAFSLLSCPDTLVFFSPGFRVVNHAIKETEVDLMFQRGPGDPEPITHSEVIVQVSQSESFVYVPYCSFASHFNSEEVFVQFLKRFDSVSSMETFKHEFNTAIKINALLENRRLLWDLGLTNILEHADYLTIDDMMQLLASVDPYKDCLDSFLYNRTLWKRADAIMLYRVMFRYYADTEWNAIAGFDVNMMAHLIEYRHIEGAFDAFLEFVQCVKTFVPYLVTIMRVAPSFRSASCSWESLEYREDNELQFVVSQAIKHIVNNTDISSVSSVLTFNELKELMIVSPKPLAVELFDIIAMIGSEMRDYVQVDTTFLMSLSTLSYSVAVWKGIEKLQMTSNFVSLVLIMIWAGSICLHHRILYQHPVNEHMTELEHCVLTFIDLALVHRDLLRSQCEYIIVSMFPLVFQYFTLFSTFPENEEEPNVISHNMYDDVRSSICPSFGIEDIDSAFTEVCAPSPPRVPKTSEFFVKIVTEILTTNGFAVPFDGNQKPIALDNPAFNNVVAFVCDLLLLFQGETMPKLLKSFFLETVCTMQSMKLSTEAFFEVFIGRSVMLSDSVGTVVQICDCLHVLLGMRVLRESLVNIMYNMIALVDNCFQKFGRDACAKYNKAIDLVLITLFQSVPTEQYGVVFDKFRQMCQSICALWQDPASQAVWLYAFMISSQHARPNFIAFMKVFLKTVPLSKQHREVVEKVMVSSIVDCVDDIVELQEAWKAHSSQFQNEFNKKLEMVNRLEIPCEQEARKVAYSFTKDTFQINCTDFLLSHAFSHALRRLKFTFGMKGDEIAWRELMSTIAREERVSIHLVPSSWYQMVPRVFAQSSVISMPSYNIPAKRSKPLEMLRRVTDFSFCKDDRQNLLKLFIKEDAPTWIDECYLCRCGYRVPSVAIGYKTSVRFITFASLSPDGHDLQLLSGGKLARLMHYFFEGVLVGSWGNTDLFASRVVVNVAFESVTYAKEIGESSVIVLSLDVGNVQLDFRKKRTCSKFIRCVHESAPSFDTGNSLSYLSRMEHGPIATVTDLQYQHGDVEVPEAAADDVRATFPMCHCPDPLDTSMFVPFAAASPDFGGWESMWSTRMQLAGEIKCRTWKEGSCADCCKMNHSFFSDGSSIVIDRLTASLSIINSKQKKVFQITSQNLRNAISWSLSRNEMFVVVTFSAGETANSYLVVRDNGSPVRLHMLASVGFYGKSCTVVCGDDRVGLSRDDTGVFVWSLLNGRRLLSFDHSGVSAFCPDEDTGCVWLGAGDQLILSSLKGTTLFSAQFPATILQLQTLSKPGYFPTVAVSDVEGGLYTCEALQDALTVTKLASYNMPITDLSTRDGSAFVAADAAGHSHMWCCC